MKFKRRICIAFAFLAAFTLWTVLLCTVDIQAIGPNGTSVGLATLNRYVHRLTGVHMLLYHITDWLGLIPIAFMIGFAILGLIQWIKRKKLIAVDHSILKLGVFYLSVINVYFLFENIVINYRPILINGYLESSYPSSTTLLVLCVMSKVIQQVYRRINRIKTKIFMITCIILFMLFMVLSRLVSGVHWISDIIGSVLLSSGLIMLISTNDI